MLLLSTLLPLLFASIPPLTPTFPSPMSTTRAQGTPDEFFPLVSTVKLPLPKFSDAMPLRLSRESDCCAEPFSSSCCTTSMSLCVPNTESSCCFEASPRIPCEPWFEKKTLKAG